MRRIFTTILILGFLGTAPYLEAAPKKAAVTKAAKSKGKRSGKKHGSKVKKKQFVNLEGLEVQGLIDRPQTLYILKKSDTAFKDNIDDYDYMKAIVDSTYKEPF
jgi:hypothetical protein